MFERFSEQLRAIHEKRGNRHHAKMVKEYAPERLIDWLENRAVEYLKADPNAKRFKLHNFRRTAMSRPRRAGWAQEI